MLNEKHAGNRAKSEVEDGLREDGTALALANFSGKRRKAMKIHEIRAPALIFPKSLYGGFVPPLPRSLERDALMELMV